MEQWDSHDDALWKSRSTNLSHAKRNKYVGRQSRLHPKIRSDAGFDLHGQRQLQSPNMELRTPEFTPGTCRNTGNYSVAQWKYCVAERYYCFTIRAGGGTSESDDWLQCAAGSQSLQSILR